METKEESELMKMWNGILFEDGKQASFQVEEGTTYALSVIAWGRIDVDA